MSESHDCHMIIILTCDNHMIIELACDSHMMVASHYSSSPGLAYDTVEFLVDNMELLLNTTTIFSKYFPSILKVCYALDLISGPFWSGKETLLILFRQILAWSPITFISEFLQLLPGFISKSAAAEVSQGGKKTWLHLTRELLHMEFSLEPKSLFFLNLKKKYIFSLPCVLFLLGGIQSPQAICGQVSIWRFSTQ